MTAVPLAGLEVGRQALECGRQRVAEVGEVRDAGPYDRIEIRVGPGDSQNDRARSGSQVRTTIRRATRRISANPRSRSRQWWTVSTARAASTAPSSSGMAWAVACTAGASTAGRCAIMTSDGSTASTVSGGSYEPDPAPTLTTDRAPPRARLIAASIRRSGRLVCAYVIPMRS